MTAPFDLVSRDAQLALTEFSGEFDQALALQSPDQWSRMFGLYKQSRAIQNTFPLPISAFGFRERSGDDKLRSIYEKSITVRPREWTDGVAELASIVEAPDFIGWAGAPAQMALEAQRQPNLLIAEMLHDNPLLDLYRVERPGGSVASTIRLFANNHPVNIFDSTLGTFDNDHAAASIGADMVKAAKERFRAKKGPNGKPMGLRFDTLLVPAAREEEANDFFQSDNLILAVTEGGANVGGVPTNNRFKGTVRVVVCDELEDDNMVYALDSRARCYPWIILDGGAPEEIRFDKTDALYKSTSKIGLKYVLRMGCGAALPHAIERITLSS